jgi:3-hydroxyacyl-[acyl-carrier-protein] dehydratase
MPVLCDFLEHLMPPALLFDISKIDLNKVIFDRDAVLSVNPQSYEMQQLDGIIWYNKDTQEVLGFKDVTDKEFWVRGHIPGRPLMPGVIMVEAAAQLSSFYVKQIVEMEGFVGFASIEEAKFRQTVVPGQRLLLLGKLLKYNPRKFTFGIQGLVGNSMVFEVVLSGMKI